MKQLVLIINPLLSDPPLLNFAKRYLLLPVLICLGISISVPAETVKAAPALPPVAICKSISVSLGMDGSVSISGSDVNNGSHDPDGIITNLMVFPSTFGCSQIGPNTVTLTVTDNEGLSSTCTSTVTVLDNLPPVVNLKPFDLVLGSSGTATLAAENIDNGSSDNCGSVTLSLSQTSFTCSDLGERIVTLTATDSHGNSSFSTATVTVTSTLDITGISLNSCDLAPSLALFEAEIEGGNGTYSYLWKGIEESSLPFMIIIPFPPALQFFNTITLEKPFFNNTMADGIYNIRLIVTDGNGCTDSSEIRVRKNGVVFNNITMRYSEACQGEIRTYSVSSDPNATYSWSVENGTILTADQNSRKIDVMWDPGATLGVVTAILRESNSFFPGGECQSSVVDSVTLNPNPVPAFVNPAVNVCAGKENTYTLTNTYALQLWTVTGGIITDGGGAGENFVTVRWGTVPTGSISVIAGNDSGCTGSVLISISVFNLAGSITDQTEITCNGLSDGTVTVLATAGTGQEPYYYTIDGGSSWQLSGTFTGLSIGNHVVTIRDALLCTIDLPFILGQPSQVTGTIQTRTDVSCFGRADGSVTISAAGGTPPYQYSLNAGGYQDQNVFTGLAAGNYTVSIHDSHNCLNTVAVTINQPAAVLNGTAVITNVSCFGGTNGSVDLSVTGGTFPYTFAWDNGTSTEDLQAIGSGTYNVLITDSRGCTASVQAIVTQPASAITGSVVPLNVLCFGEATGAVNLSVTGGTPSYTFLWSNGASTEDIMNLTAGNYSVTITDGNGCTATSSGTVSQPPAALAGTIVTQNNVLCRGDNNGSIAVSGNGGTGTYEYRIGSGSYQVSGTFGPLAAGTYSITIRDANLCTFGLSVTITEPASVLSGNISSLTNILCFGSSTGSLTADAAGGTFPYQYSIDGGVYQTSPTFNGLTEGNHTVSIRDFNLCSVTLPVTLTQPGSAVTGSVVSQVNVNCFGATTGSVTVAGSGGSPPYSYSIDGGAPVSSGIFGNLTAGIHNIVIRDLNLCQFNIPVTLTQPASALSVTTSRTNVLCFGGNTGSASAEATGGTSPYSYSWNTTPVRTTQSISGLTAGSYTVTVTDNNGCTAVSAESVSQPSGQLSGTISITDADCFGNATGTVNLTVSNGASPVSYLWNTGATTEDLSAMIAGTYTVGITDANGCTAIASGTVGQPAVLAASMTVTDIICFGSSTGAINLSVSGGTLPYSYLWTSGAVSEDLTGIPSGDYAVTVTDAHGCKVVANASVTQPVSGLTGSIVSKTDVTVYGGNDGSVTVEGSGGILPYEYSFEGGLFQLSGVFTSIPAGSFTVTIRDANLCVFDIPFTISQPENPITLNIISQVNIQCNGEKATVTVQGAGGSPPYEYSITAGTWQQSGQFDSLSPGTYVFIVRDAALSLAEIPVTINEPDELLIEASANNSSCPDTEDGSISLTISGGTSPYSIIWSDGILTQDRTGITSGTYSVAVTDQNLCAKSLVVEVGFTGSFDCVVIPQLITPNGDGFNDEWIIRNIDIYPEAEILVYNRWGKLVFRSRNIADNPWDGRSDGKLVPTDSYHYILYLNDGSKPKSGVISVIR